MSTNELILTPKKIKGEDGYRVFSIRIKEETVTAIDTLVVQTGHSRNQLIGLFLEYALQHCVFKEEETTDVRQKKEKTVRSRSQTG